MKGDIRVYRTLAGNPNQMLEEETRIVGVRALRKRLIVFTSNFGACDTWGDEGGVAVLVLLQLLEIAKNVCGV